LIKKISKHLISKLFFRYCFKESDLARYLVVYFIPDTIRQIKNKEKLNGKFLFGQINKEYNDKNKECLSPFLDISIKDGKIIDL
jgi:major membrane immunogen (membrane-anchored lipoprotein)